MPEYTLSASMERLLKLRRDYEPPNIWNMDETGCFSMHCPKKDYLVKRVKQQGVKYLKPD